MAKISRRTRLLQKALHIPDPELVYSTVEIQSVKQQIAKRRREDDPILIICPYCLADNYEGQPFCCNQLRNALELIFAPVNESTPETTN